MAKIQIFSPKLNKFLNTFRGKILNNENIKIFDINKDLEVQFSSYVIESFYQILLD